MKKNLIAGIVVSLAMTGFFGGVSFATDAAAPAAPAKVEVKAEKAPAVAKKKVAPKKKADKKKAEKKVEVKTEAAGK
jgi:Zn-dependent metalloprotease